MIMPANTQLSAVIFKIFQGYMGRMVFFFFFEIIITNNRMPEQEDAHRPMSKDKLRICLGWCK